MYILVGSGCICSQPEDHLLQSATEDPLTQAEVPLVQAEVLSPELQQYIQESKVDRLLRGG